MPALTDVIPIQGMRSAPHLDFAGEMRAATNFPTFHAARIPDVATARHAIASGQARHGRHDARAYRRSAHRAQDHRAAEDEIRPCVGATYCLDRIYQGGAAYCIHNAATGRELDHAARHPARADASERSSWSARGRRAWRRLASRAERGHEVLVFEAANQPGGQIRLTAQSPRRKEMIGIIDWRLAQCETARRDVPLQHLGGRGDWCSREQPDVVIVATGGLPNGDRAEGAAMIWSPPPGTFLSGDVEARARTSWSSTTPAIMPRCRPPK